MYFTFLNILSIIYLEQVKTMNKFTELSNESLQSINGGGLLGGIGDFIGKAGGTILDTAKFVYDVGKDLGSAIHTFCGCPKCWW